MCHKKAKCDVLIVLAMIFLGTQSALGAVAGLEGDPMGFILGADITASGTKVFVEVTLYGDPILVPESDQCNGGSSAPGFYPLCWWDCGNGKFTEYGCGPTHLSNPMFSLILKRGGEVMHFFFKVDPSESWFPDFTGNEKYACRELLFDKISGNWGITRQNVPLCALKDMDLLVPILNSFVGKVGLPAILGTGGPVSFQWKQVDTKTWNDEPPGPYWVTFNAEIAVR